MEKLVINDVLHRKVEELSELDVERRQSQELQNRIRLRDLTTQLREVHESHGLPGSLSSPSFILGDAPGFKGIPEPGMVSPALGHLNPADHEKLMNQVREMANRPDAPSRASAASRAADTVAHAWANKHGHPSAKDAFVHEARGQVAMSFRALGQQAGLGPLESRVAGHALERALETRGFRVIAGRAFDTLVDTYHASASSVARATGLQHGLERACSQSMNWLASHGVSRDVVKSVLTKHAGKFTALAQFATNPEALQRAAYVLSHSESVAKGAYHLMTDTEFRKSVGSLVLATGEAVAGVNKGAGSAAIVAGSLLRGESAEDVGRHILRAGFAVAGGALGGVAGSAVAPGFGTVAGSVAGASWGSALADKVLEKYDEMTGRSSHMDRQHSVSRDELDHSKAVLVDRVKQGATHELEHLREGGGKSAALDRVQEVAHEMTRYRSLGTR